MRGKQHVPTLALPLLPSQEKYPFPKNAVEI
jgi:hypothetical protein